PVRGARGHPRRPRHGALPGTRGPGRRRRGAAGAGRRRARSGRSRGGCMNALLQRLPQVWREAVEELWRRRLRTLLTLLGLIFGVGAIVAMQAVGEGSRREAVQMVARLGLNHLLVEAKPEDEAPLKETRARRP